VIDFISPFPIPSQPVPQIQLLWLEKAISLQEKQGFSHCFQQIDCRGNNCPALLQYTFSTGVLALKKKNQI